jgi:hypothetical protein
LGLAGKTRLSTHSHVYYLGLAWKPRSSTHYHVYYLGLAEKGRLSTHSPVYYLGLARKKNYQCILMYIIWVSWKTKNINAFSCILFGLNW